MEKNIHITSRKHYFMEDSAQDHINSNLLFLGTEFGVYFSNNGGIDWIKLSGGIPNISVRDLSIQKEKMI